MLRKYGFLLLCALLAGRAHAADPLDGFDTYVRDAMKAWQTPGLSVAIVRDGKVILNKGYGTRKQGTKAPVDADTVFAAGSISKTFTAAAVAALIARDRMRWDDRVIDHLPAFRLYDPYMTREIRLRDLLSHRSGLPRGEMLWYYSTFDRKEILRRLRFLEPEAGFRERFGYQNLMFVAAGEAVAAAAGVRWDAFVATTFFKPLEMTRTSTSVKALGGNTATPHARVDGVFKPIDWLNVDNIAPAGGVNSSANDLARWMLFQLADGRIGDQPILDPGDVAEMRTPHTVIRISEERRSAIPETLFRAYGLGWYLDDYRGVRLAYHGGRIDGMSSRLTLVPERRIGITVLTNRGRSGLPDALTYRLLDAFLGAPPRDWSGDLLALAEDHFDLRSEKRATELAQRVPGTKPSLPLERYAGTFDSALYGPLDVGYDGKGLMLRRNAMAIASLSHFNFDTFLADFKSPALRDRLVTFSLDKLGRVAALDLEFEARFVNVTPPLPADLSIAAPAGPATGGPAPGLWSGRWNDVQPVTVAVEKIDADSAQIVYAWGPAPPWDVAEGGWQRLRASRAGSTLGAELGGGRALQLVFEGPGRLTAHYRDEARRRTATLRQIR